MNNEEDQGKKLRECTQVGYPELRKRAMLLANAKIEKIKQAGLPISREIYGKAISTSWRDVKLDQESCQPIKLTEEQQKTLEEILG